MKERKWKFITKLGQHGHKLWKCESDDEGYAISDESGSTPDKADDGILWVDMIRPIILGSQNATFGVISERDGANYHTITTYIGAAKLVELFDMSVATDEKSTQKLDALAWLVAKAQESRRPTEKKTIKHKVVAEKGEDNAAHDAANR